MDKKILILIGLFIGLFCQAQYDPNTDSEKITELNPSYANYISVQHPIDSTNGVVGSHYEYYYCEQYTDHVFEFVGTNSYFRLFATLVTDAVIPDIYTEPSSDWVDITQDVFGADSVTKDLSYFRNAMPYAILLKYYNTNVTNSADGWYRKY